MEAAVRGRSVSISQWRPRSSGPSAGNGPPTATCRDMPTICSSGQGSGDGADQSRRPHAASVDSLSSGNWLCQNSGLANDRVAHLLPLAMRRSRR